MIGGMRKFARSKWALVLLFIPLVIALAVTLPDTFGGGLSGGTLSKVGDREIKGPQVRQEIDRAIRRVLIEENKVVSLEEAAQPGGLAEREYLSLEYQNTLLAFADKMGIRASAEALKPYLERNQVLTNAFGKVDIAAILVAILGFSLNFGAYVSEMMRAGIEAVDKGQIEAARALGFTKARTFWKITFPQAARHFLPVYKGEFISMVKMTSVVGYIAIQDLTKVSDIIRSRTLEAFFPLLATAFMYFLVANVLTLLLSRVEIKLDPKRRKRVMKGVVVQ